ncbi:MAG: DarT ssDNA thymidine ADP-ribosyltransferase family protein [Aulosira sp. ZfuVER01]|nr:DarT ssDNA thymidine ADP-ribosyltransferase family protein [Aulosira sp. ZfuVER01]MDZ7996630.1 DarT ssDNA thymidine ADP-ribosyltransferase family protein [Aulosira sp. DedVER01a]MDZ8053867.1 DarT ssDNA thymidine ADP-ribosyltransferase family protein [Aulosira sp. ZfuCHP01]
MSIKNQKLLYHLTSLDNFESILNNGLLARNNIGDFDDVAELDIINFRKEKNLTRYVPFHFFAKNPFDGRVQKNFPDKEFIYICVKRDFAKNNNFLIIPKHPRAMKSLILYEYLEGYQMIEWDIMDKRDYADDNCRHICMAECLSPKTISHSDFSHIFVRSQDTQDFINEICSYILGDLPNFYVNVNPNMFID